MKTNFVTMVLMWCHLNESAHNPLDLNDFLLSSIHVTSKDLSHTCLYVLNILANMEIYQSTTKTFLFSVGKETYQVPQICGQPAADTCTSTSLIQT